MSVIQLTSFVNHILALENNLLNRLTCMVNLTCRHSILSSSFMLGASVEFTLPWNSSHSYLYLLSIIMNNCKTDKLKGIKGKNCFSEA